METDSEQGFEVVLAHAANFTVGERSHGDGGQAGEQIYFNHAPIDDDKNNNVQRKHGNVNKERLEPQAQQRAYFHRLQGGLQIVQHGRADVGGAAHQPCGIGNHALGHIKYRHDDIECIGENEDGRRRFENPLEENPVVQIV